MPRKVDVNQPEIVKTLRDCGCHVALTHEVGRGFPDIVVSWNGFTVLVEIKDGAKPPSARKLTIAEDFFRTEFQGWYEVVESVDDAIKLFNQIRKRFHERSRAMDLYGACNGRA